MNPCKCGCGVLVSKVFKKGHGRRRPLAERFMEKVEAESPEECWSWLGAVATSGYGRIGIGDRTDQAHRVAYRLNVGPIPVGLHIDHLCNNRLCVNPSHLQPVTQAENNRRAAERRSVLLRLAQR